MKIKNVGKLILANLLSLVSIACLTPMVKAKMYSVEEAKAVIMQKCDKKSTMFYTQRHIAFNSVMSSLDDGMYDFVPMGEELVARSLDELKSAVFHAQLESISNFCADDTDSGLRAYGARAGSAYELSCTMEAVANAYMALSSSPCLFY